MQSKGKEDDGKGRTCFQEVSLNGQHGTERPFLTQAQHFPGRCSFTRHPPAHKTPTLLSEELAVLGQLQLQLISIISLICKLLLQPSHLELWSLQDVAHGGGWRT